MVQRRYERKSERVREEGTERKKRTEKGERERED